MGKNLQVQVPSTLQHNTTFKTSHDLTKKSNDDEMSAWAPSAQCSEPYVLVSEEQISYHMRAASGYCWPRSTLSKTLKFK